MAFALLPFAWQKDSIIGEASQFGGKDDLILLQVSDNLLA
jgi:hypothetical protein